jgi:uncharacterized repeat protein (TIGR01451 family)
MKKVYLLFSVALFCLAANGFASGHVATITVNQNASCFGFNDGNATASVSGGTGPFSYIWNNSASGATQTNLTAGNYYCIVTDSSDLSTDTAFCTITQPAQINAVATNTGPYCFGATIALMSSGGGTYAWSGPTGFTSSLQNPTQSNATPSQAGVYTVTVTVGGCTATAVTNVFVDVPPVGGATNTGPYCTGGTIQLFATGNAVAFSWSGPNGFSSTIQNPTITNASPAQSGTYTLTFYTPMGCLGYDATVVSVNASPVILLSPSAASACNACDGAIVNSVSGGTNPYTFSWTGPNSYLSSTQNITNLCTGIYTVSVTDANGCTNTANTIVSNQSISVSTSTTTDSCGAGNGSAVANASSVNGNVTYSWLPGNMTTQGIYGLNAGTYTVTVTDTTGCSGIATASILNTSSPTPVTTSNAASCGAANGMLAAAASGGASPYQYSLNGGAFSTANSWNNIVAGSYTVTVKDNAGCMATTTAIVPNAGLSATMNTVPAVCNNNTSGSATITPTTGSAPYTYLWSNGATTQTISNIINGGYTVTVTDAGGCVGTFSTWIYQYSSIYLYPGYTYENCGINSITATPYGGTAPYTYTWIPGGQTTQTIANVPAGTYSVSVTDANGCTGSGTYYCYPYDYTLITGNIYADNNGNCTNDGGDFQLNSWYVVAQSGSATYYGGTWNGNGNYVLNVPPVANTYTISAVPYYGINPAYFALNCANNYTVTTTGTCDTITNLDFPFTLIPSQDLQVDVNCGPARPGFTRNYAISYRNPGTIAMSGTVKFDIDPLLTFSGATPPPNVFGSNHVEWNFSNLQPGQAQYIYISATLPSTVSLGTPVNDIASIDPLAGDLTPGNNTSNCGGVVVGGYDPNEKEVYSPQADANGVIDTSGADLFYTVHFQNTGTDTAFAIVVRDTLSPLVNLTSLEMLTASHNYSWSIQPGRCLEVKFNNILLVDSNMNEPLSHGYFNYRIHTGAIAAGNTIENTAGIYFDFNAPVITNTVSTPVAITTGIVQVNSLKASVYPNPTTSGTVRVKLNASSYKNVSFSMYDAGGRVVRSKNYSNTFLFDVDMSGLEEGVYFYTVTNEKGERAAGKIVVGK